jgi:Sap-like sulfolipid-1-addressing protein
VLKDEEVAVSIQALLLALTTVVRPTSIAALFAMLSTPRPRRLLAVYIAVGLIFSAGVGIVVAVALGDPGGLGRSRVTRPVLNVLLGVGLLVYALYIAIRSPKPADGGRMHPAAWMERVTARMSVPAAALTGVLTHLPGVVYLAALNAIAHTSTGPVGQVVQVLIYNGIWFSLPIVALVLSIRRPSASRELLERIGAVTHRYQKPIVSVGLAVIGSYLVVVGLSTLLDAKV